ncbi:MAG: hypothetical protein AAFP77_16325 [Bacteroidota bacterium]
MEKPLSDRALIHNAYQDIAEAKRTLYLCWPPRAGRAQTEKLEQIKELLTNLDQEPAASEPRVAWHLGAMARAWVGLILDGFISYPKARPKIEPLLRMSLDHLADHIEEQ